MLLTLIREGGISRLSLPARCSGRYWVTYTDASGGLVSVISVEGIDGRWMLKSNKQASVLDANGESVKETVLEPNRIYGISLGTDAGTVLLHVEPPTEDRRKYRKYALPEQGALMIGRAETADIRFHSKLVSLKHARITVGKGAVTITDTESSNGTFVNGRRATSATLMPGDVVSIIGLKLIVGKGFIALNDPDGLVTVNEAVLAPLPAPQTKPSGDDEIEESIPGALFFRSPRFRRDISRAVIKIDPPPQPNTADETPLTMVIGPAMTMGMASVAMAVFAIINVTSNKGSIMQALPTVTMSAFMLLGMILWPVMSRRYERRRRTQREAERHDKYRAYIGKMRDVIDAERVRQSGILRANLVTMEDCVSRIRGRERSLWERTIGHGDFLRVRLGMGAWPLEAEIKYAERKFSVDEDELQEEMYELVEEPKRLEDVPVSLSLLEQPIVGITGPRSETRDFVRELVLQLAALHSYDELKLVFLFNEGEADQWDFVRWLPHTWSDDRSVRFVAASPSEVKELSTSLEPEFARREEITTEEELRLTTPHYVVFALDRELARKAEFVRKILAQKKSKGFSLIALYDELPNLPKECRAVIEIDGDASKIYDRDDITGEHIAFKPDPEVGDDARELAECLANTRLDSAAAVFSLPSVITFLELLGVGKVEHLNALARWKENNPVQSLEAPIGVDTTGEPFKLDLHERFHGPHGLIAGMTGSGKSEFIMTYILSLAVNYHPDEVAFVLIDYKGGGMANAFVDLPHVAGTITNLDGAAVNRSLISIQSELKRRQAVFNDASEKTGHSNIDIYKYQSLYRDGLVSEPLPHLLIISDEFAELKTQQPDFMTQLVSAARIGRSLGVHLILATQKPAGVVDDQIWSNSRFRVCLKVQETADSMEVIKRPDAAALSTTGRFYVQVGFNEVFELGQSAWAGAPYYPADRAEKAYDYSVTMVDRIGRPVKQVVVDKRRNLFRNPPKQLDEVTKYLVRLAREEKVKTRRLWLDPIPELIYVDDVLRRDRRPGPLPFVLDPVVGEYDDPANQRQAAMSVPLTEQGNVVIYGAGGSGKTTLLTTLLHSLISRHTPEEVSLYLLDFASETLRSFSAAPHVGDVLTSGDDEKIDNLLRMLGDEIARRKRLFSDHGGDYRSYIASGQKLDSIVVVIHNYSAFAETYDDKEETIAYLTREGSKYGVHFVLTAATPSSVRYRILQNFKQLLVLQLNDPTDYAAVLGNTGGVIPSAAKGRGIFRTDGVVFEFQTAHTAPPETEHAFIRESSAKAAEAWTGLVARRIPILPDVVDSAYLAKEIAHGEPGLLPIGIDKNSLEVAYFDFRKPFVSVALSTENEGHGFTQGLAEALGVRYGERAVVLDAEGIFAPDSERSYGYVGDDPAALNKAVLALFDEMLRRNNDTADARQAGKQLPPFEERLYLVPSLSALLSRLSPQAKEKFTAMLERCDGSLGVNFVFGDSAASLSTMIYEPWAKAHVSTNTGIWIGDGLTNQFTLQPAKTTTELYQEIGDDFGYVLTRGKPRLVKLLSSRLRANGGGQYE